MNETNLKTAVLIPCMNEEATVAKVVAEISDALPEAKVYVYDNASTDRTFELAQQAGAEVLTEPIPGKGNVVRRISSNKNKGYHEKYWDLSRNMFKLEV